MNRAEHGAQQDPGHDGQKDRDGYATKRLGTSGRVRGFASIAAWTLACPPETVPNIADPSQNVMQKTWTQSTPT
jgi:hypothetical protein